MHTIDTRWLEHVGLETRTLPAEDINTLIQKSVAELEKRVGENIAGHLSDSQIDEFEELLQDGGNQLEWLRNNFPTYEQTVLLELGSLEDEIRASDQKIPLIMSWDYPLN